MQSKLSVMLEYYRVVFLIVFLFIFQGWVKGADDTKYKSENRLLPLATGTFWQIGSERLHSWTDEQLANEVRLVKNMGMDVILIHYSAYWKPEQASYQTLVSGTNFIEYDNLQDRDPLGAIFSAAERWGVQIVVGDFLVPPDLRYERPVDAFEYWVSDEAMHFRQTVVERYKESPSFFGYYIANEPNPNNITSRSVEALWRQSTKKVAAFVKSLKRDLTVIHSIGLYPEWFNGMPSPPSPAFLDEFWRPWVSQISEIDVWMIIDGIGTSLSTHDHTAKAQKWGRKLVSEYDREYWVDVENATMTSGFVPFSISQLKRSLQIAAATADKIVLFEHLSYMSPNSGKDDTERLYSDYLEYKDAVTSLP